MNKQERDQASRLSRFLTHILRQAMQEGLSDTEAQEIGEICSNGIIESGVVSAEAWDRYRPEVVK